MNINISPEQLLAEIDDLVRTMPAALDAGNGSSYSTAWLGRTAAILTEWDYTQGPVFKHHIDNINSGIGAHIQTGLKKLSVMLSQAR